MPSPEVVYTIAATPDVTTLSGPTSIVANYPATVAAGDHLLLVTFERNQLGSSARPTATGWTLTGAGTTAVGDNISQCSSVGSALKIAAGTEGGTTVTVTRGGTSRQILGVAIFRMDAVTYTTHAWAHGQVGQAAADPHTLTMTEALITPNNQPAITVSFSCFRKGNGVGGPSIAWTDDADEGLLLRHTKDNYGNPNNSNLSDDVYTTSNPTDWADDAAINDYDLTADDSAATGSYNSAGVRAIWMNAQLPVEVIAEGRWQVVRGF